MKYVNHVNRCEPREILDIREPRESRESRDSRFSRISRISCDSLSSRGSCISHDSRESLHVKYMKYVKCVKYVEIREIRESRELMDNGDSNPGAQWKRRDYRAKLKAAKHVVLSFDGARRGGGDGAAAWMLWIRNMKGEFERISHGGKVLKDTTAMNVEREALRLGVEYLMSLFLVEAKDFQFVVENESRETKCKVDTLSMRLFGLRNDCAEDVHRADANRFWKKREIRVSRDPSEST